MPTPADPRLRRLAAFLALAGLFRAAPASSQTIHGELVESGTGTPVSGAFVVLLDADGEQRDADLTDGEGRFILSARGAGAYALGLDRIGYLSARTDPIALREGQMIRYRLETVVEPVALEDIDVAVENECRVRPEEGRAVARVWEEARKALNATAFTQRMGLLRYTVVATERSLDPYSGNVREESSRRRSGVTHGSPYVALPPEVLARTGFAKFAGEVQTYYGPDAGTLLSDAFLDTHCLRLREPPPESPAWIGVAFEPVRDHRLPDIRGTLWLDEATAELERIDYAYTNLPVAVEDRGAGGEIDFERLDTGEWIVREWTIRMPVVRMPDEGMYSHLTMDPNTRVATVVRLEEEGGEVVEIVPARGGGGARRVWAEPIEWRAAFAAIEAEAVERAAARRDAEAGARAAARDPEEAELRSEILLRSPGPGGDRVRGVVFDVATGEPVEGAQVSVAGTGAVTDEDGAFDVSGIPPGPAGLRVERLGYGAADAEVEAGARVEVRLVPTAIAVDPLEVEVVDAAERARRARGHVGWLLTADEIPEATTVALAELLSRRFAAVRTFRPARTGCPTVEVRSGEIGLVILDGQPIRDTCILDHILPQDIVTVEVIPGLAGGVTYGRTGGAGVIVIETRRGEE